MSNRIADLVAGGIEVMAESEEAEARQFTELSILIAHPGLEPAAGVCEVVRMLRDAAESAADAHATDDDAFRIRRFVAHLTLALEEIQ